MIGDDKLLVLFTDRISPFEFDPLKEEEEEMASCIELPFSSSAPSPCLCLLTSDELDPNEPDPTPFERGGDLRLSAMLLGPPFNAF